MTNQAQFLFVFPSTKDALLVVQSLLPEVKQKIPKSQVSFCVDKKTMVLTIKTEDISSLRASCNSYLRWIQTAISVQQLV